MFAKLMITTIIVIELIPASFAIDYWALGVLMAVIYSGSSLFKSDMTTDNISDALSLTTLMEWSSKTKADILTSIQTNLEKEQENEDNRDIVGHHSKSFRNARNLISILLSKNPAHRPSCEKILKHPFFTNTNPIRLSDEEASFDVFISYRVASDSSRAQFLYKRLTAAGLKVWFDQECLKDGKNWKIGFAEGLINSRVFVCLISRDAIEPEDPSRRITCLKPTSPCDNVILEWRLSLELHDRGMIQHIYPIFVNNRADGTFERYQRPPFTKENHVVVKEIEDTLSSLLDDAGLGSPSRLSTSVQQVYNSITEMQGCCRNEEFNASVDFIVNKVHSMCQKEDISKETSPHKKSQEEVAKLESEWNEQKNHLTTNLIETERKLSHCEEMLRIHGIEITYSTEEANN